MYSRWQSSGNSTDFITDKLVLSAIKSFGPYKAAGPDEIFPGMLSSCAEDLALILVPILKACLEFGYTPVEWRKSRVTFIPKPGKDSYQKASSWRPISLTSFMVKLLERLVDWHLRTPEFEGRLRRAGQFAYLKGVSTDAALHNYVARAEKTIKQGEMALGVFMDIEGAFSHAPFKSLTGAMTRAGVDGMLVRWTRNMLSTRSVVANAM